MGRWELLEGVFLEGRQISRVCSMGNLRADRLGELRLAGNRVTGLMWIRGVDWPGLKVLDLGGNTIAGLDGLEAAKLPSLRVVNLGDNRIKKVHQLK